MKELKISAIENGTVIDHIPADATFKVVHLFNLEGITNVVSAATNLESKRVGKKGIVKIGGKFLSIDEANKIAIIAPNATLCIIKDFKVTEKTQLTIPKSVEKIIKCFNPRCITNHEMVTTKFDVVKKEPLLIRCYYCERCMEKEDIQLN